MNGEVRKSDQAAEGDDTQSLPKHLSALVGALVGPEDLARNHDKYLTYSGRDDAEGAASA